MKAYFSSTVKNGSRLSTLLNPSIENEVTAKLDVGVTISASTSAKPRRVQFE